MPTLPVSTQNSIANHVAGLIDVGTTDANGDLVIQTAGSAAVATLAFANPAFGNAAGGVATANAIASDTNAAGGTATKFITQDRDNAEVFEGTVGTSGAELNLSSTTINPGDTVAVNSFTITQPAS